MQEFKLNYEYAMTRINAMQNAWCDMESEWEWWMVH